MANLIDIIIQELKLRNYNSLDMTKIISKIRRWFLKQQMIL